MAANITYSYPWNFPVAFPNASWEDNFSRTVLNLGSPDMYTTIFIGTGAVEFTSDENSPDANLATQGNIGSMSMILAHGVPVFYGKGGITKTTVSILTELTSVADMTMRAGIVGGFPTNEAQFRFDSSSDPDYQCRTSGNGTTLTTDSGSPVLDTQSLKLSIVLDSSVPDVEFLLNDVSIATHNVLASLPSQDSTMTLVLQIRSTAASNKEMALRNVNVLWE